MKNRICLERIDIQELSYVLKLTKLNETRGNKYEIDFFFFPRFK